MTYDRVWMGTRIGKFLRGHRALLKPLVGMRDIFTDLLDEGVDLFTDEAGLDQVGLDLLTRACERVKSQTDSLAARFKSAGQSFIQNVIGPNIGEASSNIRDILLHLRSDFLAATDYVLAQPIAHTEPIADEANTGDGLLAWDASDPTDQSALHGNLITIECVTAATNGGVFDVTSSLEGFIGQATVGEDFSALFGNADENREIGVKFQIADGGTDFVVGDKIYISTWFYQATAIVNDGGTQLSNVETDRLDVWRSPDAKDSRLYAELTDAAGDRTVEIFKEVGKTTTLASGTLTGDGEIYCDPSAHVDAVGIRVDVAYSGDDLDIYFSYADDYSLFQFFFIQLLRQRVPMPTAGGGTQWTESWAE